MRRFALFAVLMVGLAGCATKPSYGNFTQNTIATDDKKIADDAIKKLVTLYPPAHTRFDLQHATPDPFGTYLVQSMRAKGYAVREFKPDRQPQVSTGASAGSAAAQSLGLPLSYIIDQAKDSDLYRLTLVINHQQSLDRVYQLKEGTIYPAGYWVRKE